MIKFGLLLHRVYVCEAVEFSRLSVCVTVGLDLFTRLIIIEMTRII